MTKELLPIDEPRKEFLEIEHTPGEDAVKTVEMTAKDSEYYIHLPDKVVAGLRERTPILKVLWVLCYPTTAHEKRTHS